ncbi:MAG TPA: transporter substrate-binding domain-containing protein [Spirochaetota bacterium]|nr:transporter substrate-binding domain-containing protein [Spirochaetota bacterium]HPJ36424.1 transporter substrate-binding domain-containing protein [Spirochaetota bacterium]
MKKFIVLLIAVVTVISGCAKKDQGNLLEDIKKRGTLRIGMSTFVPWAMNDREGKLIGFEIDVAAELAKDMGVKAEFVPTKWSGIIPALLTGKFDLIIGGMGITEERMQKVDFSDPYDYSGMSIVASRKKAPGLNSLDDFNKKGVVIAARLGTTAAEAVKKYFPDAEIKLFEDEAQAIQELLTDRVHAVVASAPLPEFQAIKYSDRFYLPLQDTFTKEPIGFAMRKGEEKAKNYFNAWIKEKHEDGFLKEKKRYWFRSRDWDSRLR